MSVKPQALLFDWDNTLVDSWECIRESYNRTFRHFGMPDWSMDEIKAKVAKSMRDSFPQMFGDRWEEAGRVFSETYAAIHLSYLQPLPGAAEMLQRLHDAGLYLGVVSNKRGHFLRQEATALGWDRYFSRLVGAQDAEQDKPHTAPVTMALSGSGLQTGPHIWFVGDAAIDMECARNSGCCAVLFRPDQVVEEEFQNSPPDFQITCCAELAGLAL